MSGAGSHLRGASPDLDPDHGHEMSGVRNSYRLCTSAMRAGAQQSVTFGSVSIHLPHMLTWLRPAQVCGFRHACCAYNLSSLVIPSNAGLTEAHSNMHHVLIPFVPLCRRSARSPEQRAQDYSDSGHSTDFEGV